MNTCSVATVAEHVFNDQMDARDLRADLIAAAVTMLAEPQAVAVPSLRSIARKCQVAPSAVYWHFPSEAELRSAVLEVVYADMVECIGQAISDTPKGADPLVAQAQAYVRWGLAHPGAYQLLFESNDPVPVERTEHGPRLQNRIVELVAAADPSRPLASALLLWSAYHGLVSLRLHKTEWDWELSADEATARIVTAMTAASTGAI